VQLIILSKEMGSGVWGLENAYRGEVKFFQRDELKILAMLSIPLRRQFTLDVGAVRELLNQVLILADAQPL
jgi:hypothetical protein